MKLCSIAALACLLLAIATNRASALGTEEFGNKPLSPQNYETWPGIMPVINHEARVYQCWVNGNEHFYYEGSVEALNATLQDFAAAETKGKQIVLRPEPGIAHTFHGMEIDCQWELHLVGGIARHLTTLDKGELIWNPAPVLTVYVGKEIDIRKVKIPEGVKVSGLKGLKRDCARAIQESTDISVRGWGCGNLAQLDPYDDESLQVIASRLDDNDKWVRLNAAGALATFGVRAKPILKSLEMAAQTDDAGLKAAAEKSITAINGAAESTETARRHRELITEIEKVVAAHNKSGQ